ncbi:MAG: DNA replication/repair protein RecF [Bombella sp.]|nr:DNA replication/repair protein RecF [Bombella sp.]
MNLHRLTLTDFRNYRRCVWEPSATLSVLTGENGSGKTNFLEALSLLAPGRGLLGSPAHMLPRHGTTQWGVAAHLEREGQQFQLSTGLTERRGRRIFLLDGERTRTMAEIARLYSCVWLTPQMERLFLEGAGSRRRFLDRLTVALLPDHTQQLMAHERSVMSRNRILLEQPDETAWLTSLEESISRHAVAITAARLHLLETLEETPFGNEAFPQTLLELHCPIATALKASPALEVEDKLRHALQQSRLQDKARKSTSIGAHRADMSLRDAMTGRQAAHSSSGQKKIMLLSVILSHAHAISRVWGQAPVILLDEPLTHLDERRRIILMDSLSALKTTTILTGTEAEPFSSIRNIAAFFHVQNGALHPA